MPRLRAALASVSCLMLVVPEVEATDLPLRSSIDLRLLDFFETKRVAVRKWVLVKETCFRRSALLVVEPHSRSMVAIGEQGNAGDDVTGLNSTSSFVELELLLHRVDDPVADVDREADRLLVSSR